jgi:hypothetical protein
MRTALGHRARALNALMVSFLDNLASAATYTSRLIFRPGVLSVTGRPGPRRRVRVRVLWMSRWRCRGRGIQVPHGPSMRAPGTCKPGPRVASSAGRLAAGVARAYAATARARAGKQPAGPGPTIAGPVCNDRYSINDGRGSVRAVFFRGCCLRRPG